MKTCLFVVVVFLRNGLSFARSFVFYATDSIGDSRINWKYSWLDIFSPTTSWLAINFDHRKIRFFPEKQKASRSPIDSLFCGETEKSSPKKFRFRIEWNRYTKHRLCERSKSIIKIVPSLFCWKGNFFVLLLLVEPWSEHEARLEWPEMSRHNNNNIPSIDCW